MSAAKKIIAYAVAVSAIGTTVNAGNLSDAYDACLQIIANNLVPTKTTSDIGFPTIDQVNATRGDEFYFAFSSGTITKATRSSPDLLTGSNNPSASCGGSLSNRRIEWVTVNGSDATNFQAQF